MTKDKLEAIKEYSRTHTITETSDHFDISRTTLYRYIREGNIPYKKVNKKLDPEFLALIREYAKEHTPDESYAYFKDQLPSVSREYFVKQANEAGIRFARKVNCDLISEKVRKYNIDEDHLKAHAHEYTIKEYMEKFNLSCARTTLIYRANVLGVQFKKKHPGLRNNKEEIVALARQKCNDMSLAEFWETYCKDICCKNTLFRMSCEENIVFKDTRGVGPNKFTEEEAQIIKDNYEELGGYCYRLLPNKTMSSIYAYAQRNGYKVAKPYSRAKQNNPRPIPSTDHLGNVYPSKAAMYKAYNIPLTTAMHRERAGWTLEEILTTQINSNMRRGQ